MKLVTPLAATALLAFAALNLFPSTGTVSAGAEEYTIDTGHSHLGFHIKHMNVSYVYGRFNEFEGKIKIDPQAPKAAEMSFELKIKTEKIDTANDRRDKHLRSPDFFNAQQFPEATFKSTKVVAAGSKWQVTGELTMLGVTKSVTAELEVAGHGPHPRGGYMVGVHGTCTFKRSDFGMVYGLDTDALGDEVTLTISLEALKQ